MTDDLLRDTRERALDLLGGLLRGDVDPMVLRPGLDDYGRIFLEEAVPSMQLHFESLWLAGIAPRPGPGQSEVSLHVALAMLLRVDNLFSRPFPGGYRRVAHLLSPELPWCCWRWHAPGGSQGMAYDGLVRVDDRFVWLPKPWRAVGRG